MCQSSLRTRRFSEYSPTSSVNSGELEEIDGATFLSLFSSELDMGGVVGDERCVGDDQ